MGYDWDFSFLVPFIGAFERATWLTIELSITSFIVGTVAGVPLGIILRVVPGRALLLLFNDAVRAVPPLVLILFAYYFPYAQLFRITPPGAFTCALVAISLSQAAYTADLVRAAIDGVSRRAIMAGRALGLKEPAIFRYIVLPDVIRQTLPAQVAFLIGIIRITSLASVIGVEEVVFVARIATSQNYRTLEAWTVVALVYVVLVVPLTVMHRRLETSPWLKRRS